MSGRFLIVLFGLLVVSFGAFGQLSEPVRWKLKQRGLVKVDVSYEGYRASDAKVGFQKSKSTLKGNSERGSSKQPISLVWNSPTGKKYEVEGLDRRKFVANEAIQIGDVSVELFMSNVDTTKNFHHFDVSVIAENEKMASLHISVQPWIDVFLPPDVKGRAELSSGRILYVEREFVTARNFWERVNRPSSWTFREKGREVAEYFYHYKRPKFAYDSSFSEQERDEMTAIMSAFSLWIRHVYMFQSE